MCVCVCVCVCMCVCKQERDKGCGDFWSGNRKQNEDWLNALETITTTSCATITFIMSVFCRQFIDRILLIFKPAKYQPDASYLRHVPIKRVHIFTAIQVGCLVVLWVIKSIKAASIVFPIMVSAALYLSFDFPRLLA